MKKFFLACALSAVAVLFYAAIGSAAGTLVSPAPNETVDSPQPTFTWTVPTGEKVSDILVAPNKHNDKGFLDQSIDDGNVSGKTSYHYTASILTPGDYYWQLSGLDADDNPAMSKIRHFVVPPIIEFSPVKAKWAPRFDNGRPVDYFVGTIRCNLINRPEVTLKVFSGQKVLGSESYSGPWCVDLKPASISDTWQKPTTMPKGTHLTMQFFVEYGKYTAKSAITPFTAH